MLQWDSKKSVELTGVIEGLTTRDVGQIVPKKDRARDGME